MVAAGKTEAARLLGIVAMAAAKKHVPRTLPPCLATANYCMPRWWRGMRGRGRPIRASSAVSPPGHSSAARASVWHIARQSIRRATVRFDCSTHRTLARHTRHTRDTRHTRHTSHTPRMLCPVGWSYNSVYVKLTRFTPLLVPQGKHIRSTVNDGRRRMEDNAKGWVGVEGK